MNRNIERVTYTPNGTRNMQPQLPVNPIQRPGCPGGTINCRNANVPSPTVNVVFITHSPTEFPIKVKMSSAHYPVVEERNQNKLTGTLKSVEFSLEMPAAKSVQLAADFTDWEAAPIDMIRFGNGIWSTMVPLPPGTYAYRFLVDGNWHDDPRAMRHQQGASGTAEAFVKID